MVLALLAILASAPNPETGAVASCPPAWEPLPLDACLLRGRRPGLAVYFHGMSAPSLQALGRELSLIEKVPAARRTSLVAIKGESGLCAWAPEYRDWWCWPSDRSQLSAVERLSERAREIVAEAAARLGEKGLRAPVLAGYSNGAYFLSLLMGETSFPASGWVLMHGGPVSGVAYALDRERPTLLLAAADDGIQRPAMEALKGKLDQAGWSSTLVVRPGSHPPELEDYQRMFDFAALAARHQRPPTPAPQRLAEPTLPRP